jgi:cytochrome c biogenesis factor
MDDHLSILDSSQNRMAADLLNQERRLIRMEAVLFGSAADESGGLRQQIATMGSKMDKEIASLNTKMDQLMFWFRLGAFVIIVFLTLFGPPQVREILSLFKGKL